MKNFLTFTALLFFSFWAVAQSPENERQAGLQLVQQQSAAIGLSQADIQNAVVVNSYIIPSSNIRMVYLQQTHQGIPVYNRIQVLAFKDGALVSNAGERIQAPETKTKQLSASPRITAPDAVQASLAALKVKGVSGLRVPDAPVISGKANFGTMNFSLENVSAELIWYPIETTGELKLVWQVFMAPKSDEDYWLARIDASTGSFIDKQSLTIKCNFDGDKHSAKQHQQHKNQNAGNHLLQTSGNGPSVVNTASYRVIPHPAESPIHPGGAPALQTDPWTKSPGNATSLGWHYDGTTYYTLTRGNNVYAYEDRAATNAIGQVATSTTAEPALTFNFVPDLAQEPVLRTPVPNQQFNITNLFYWNNLMHDLSYLYGFTETARNFQANNQGRGGTGNDYVLAEAQDGSGTNNANFSTPADGGRGRMQMYLWTAPTPDRDGDVDNGIIAHEYTHGISNRFTGNGSTCLTNAEQMGEGWSDYFGLMITHDWSTAAAGDGFSKPRGIGTYALNQPITGLGIRQYRYCTDMTVNPLTYGNLSTVAVPHGVGTIWCTALWDMTWEIIQLAGINPNIFNPAGGGGNAIALKLVSEGMRLQPCSPGFIDGRNAILRADTLFYGAQYSCAIIKAFARRGMGIGASQGSSNSRTDQTLSTVDCSSVSCSAPTGLTSSAITTTGATVSWTAASGAVSYDVDYKLASATTWTNAATATTATSVVLSGLTTASLYDWRVRTNCSSGSSAYAQAQFTTGGGTGCGVAFEPNETLATAASIATGVANSAAITTTTDNDYFRIVTTATSNIVYSLVGPSGVDYDMTILNSAGTSIGSGTGSTATETVTLNNQAAGTYYIRVFGFNGANSATCYTITATATAVPTSCASTYDVSTNGTSAGAATIPFNTDIKGLISPSGDNDYYRFVITTGGTATITLSTLPADYDLRLYSSNGTTQLAISQNGGTTSETITRTYTAGTYFARVYGYNNANNATSCYTLRVQLGTASLAETPQEITKAGALKIYPNPVNDYVNVSVLGNVDRQSLLSIFDAQGILVRTINMTNNLQRIYVGDLPKGVYLIKLNKGDGNLSSKFVIQ
ncbi:MAG: M36 family metallopeptidase [Ferruginibacter sp.]|nr:M36 family metallopeptidase [Ferruginibacter sp.]